MANAHLSKERLGFWDLYLFYANILDYSRAVLCIIATFFVYDPNYDLLFCSLILLSFYLDLYDGKLARHFKQCSTLGDGFDWWNDLYIDLLLSIWWGRIEPAVFPFIFIVTAFEILTAIVDFGISAADRYPKPPTQKNPLVIIEEWIMPSGTWTELGWYVWFSFPHWIFLRGFYVSGLGAAGFLFLSPAVTTFLIQTILVLTFPLAFMNAWHNTAWGWVNLTRWNERNKNFAKAN